MAKDVPTLRQTLCMMLAMCLLLTILPLHIYSQNDISPNSVPLIEMRFVPSCLSMNDASAAQTGTTSVKGFYIAKNKVTRRLWNEIMGTYTDGEADDYLPVTNVSHDEVQLFIFWLNQKTKMHYRLPTETEWTCAVRSGLLPDASPSRLGGNDASTGFRLAMDYDGQDVGNILERTDEDSVMAKQNLPAAEAKPTDTVKASLRELLAAEKAAERQGRAAKRKVYLNALPLTTFFTLNAQYTAMPQWSFGFKVGTVKFFGWYLSAMTNFNFRGAFSPFTPDEHYVLTGVSKTTYMEGQLGFVVRPHKLVSVHLGAGYGYRTLNFESDQGWHHYPKRSYYGPTASLGVMFHVKGVALSAEACGMVYNLNSLNGIRGAFGVRIGMGFQLGVKN